MSNKHRIGFEFPTAVTIFQDVRLSASIETVKEEESVLVPSCKATESRLIFLITNMATCKILATYSRYSFIRKSVTIYI
jgi:hypothetical protein